jgi:hypothetical protein
VVGERQGGGELDGGRERREREWRKRESTLKYAMLYIIFGVHKPLILNVHTWNVVGKCEVLLDLRPLKCRFKVTTDFFE